jgi:type I restriction enzyme S subunit
MQNFKTVTRDQLGANWITEHITDVADIVMGQSPPSSSYNKKKDGLPFFQGNKDFGEKYPNVTVYTNNPKKFSERGDTLVSVRAPIGDVNISPMKCCIGRGLAAIRPQKIDSLLLYYFFRYVKTKLVTEGTGSTFRGISKKVFEDLEITYPSNIDGQINLSKKIDEAVLLVNDTKIRINFLRKIIQRFRQSVLSAAVTGKLTEDWREKYPEKSKQNRPPFFTENKKYIVPDEWFFSNFVDLIIDGPQNGLYKPQSYYGDGVMILRIDNFYDGSICPWNKLKKVSASTEEIRKYSLQNDDVIINRVNSMPYLGKNALVTDLNDTCLFESNMMRLRINKSFVRPLYINYYLQSYQGKYELRKSAKQAVNQASINQTDVKFTLVPVPSIEEQDEIIRRVSKYLLTIECIENNIDKSSQQVARLTQAILAKAFKGEL